MNDVMFFWAGWEPVLRVVVVTTLGYVWLVFVVANSGQRSLADMTPFDFVITVTLGSAFGRVITATEVAMPEIVVAFVMLVGLKWVFAASRARGLRITSLFDSEPALVFHRGEMMEAAMRRHRLGEQDLLGAVRKYGHGSLAEVEAIVMESNGDLAVIGREQAGDGDAIPTS